MTFNNTNNLHDRKLFKFPGLLLVVLALVVVPIAAQFITPHAAPQVSAASAGKCPKGDVALYSEATISDASAVGIAPPVTDMTVTACVQPDLPTLDNVVIQAYNLAGGTQQGCMVNTPIHLVLQTSGTTQTSDHINTDTAKNCIVLSSAISAPYTAAGSFVAVWGDGTDPTDPTQGSDIVRVDIDQASIDKAKKAGGVLNEGKNTQQGKIVAKNGAGDPNATCETGGFGLNWIICPVYNGMADLSDWLFNNMVQPFLKTAPISTNPSDTSFQIWSQFRLYGNIILVIGLLVLVFGQSIGGGLIDAYTVKKSMPRVLIAAILINLSIYIVAGMVDITNVVGGSLGEVMTAPLKNAGAFKIDPSTVSAGSIVGATGIAAALTKVGLAFVNVSVGKAILLFLVMPVVFGLIAAFATLIIRKAIILALVLVSPVAFALYCLPNTEKYFRKWWEFLFRTLLVYPIVIVIFAVADILAVTVFDANSGGVSNVIALVVSFLLQFLPLLMIPYAFKLAGGAVGALHETLTNYHKRAQEGIKGNPNNPDSLRNKWGREAREHLAGQNLSGRAVMTRLNAANLLTRRGRDSRRSKLEATRNTLQAHYGKQGTGAAYYEQNKDDSNVTSDLALHATSAASRAAIESDIAAGKFERGSGDHQQRLYSSATADLIGRTPAMRRRALLNPATIGYGLKPGEEGWNQATEAMSSISGGDEGVRRSLVNEFQYLAKSAAGRPDLAAAVDGGDYDGYRGWSSVGLYQHGNGKPSSIKGSADYFVDKFRNGNDQDKERAAVFYRELTTLQGQASGAVRDEAEKQKKRMEDNGMGAYLALPSPNGGTSGTRRVRVADPTVPGGFRTEAAPANRDDDAGRLARGYDRMDPNIRETL